MTTRIEYQSIDLKSPARVIQGRSKQTSVEAVDGRRIFRVIDGGLDFFEITGPNVIANTEVPAGNVAASIRKAGPALRGKGGKAGEDG